MNKKVLIIVPAFNESENILDVIHSIKNQNSDFDILVVDDGSLDKTSFIAKSTGLASVVRLFQNLGIGGAVQTGFKFAYYNDYDIAIQFDGDGQHNAFEISNLIQSLNSGFDMIIGSRFLFKGENFKSSRLRRVGIRIFGFVNTVLINQKITDSTSGFRAFNKSAIEFLASNYPEDYPEPEAVILLKKNGFKINEIPVKMNSRTGGKSSIAGFSYINYFLKVILAVILTNFRPPLRSFK